MPSRSTSPSASPTSNPASARSGQLPAARAVAAPVAVAVAVAMGLVACGAGKAAEPPPAPQVATSPRAAAPPAAAVAPADLVLLGGAILTMDPDRPTATALAITAGRFVAVGRDADIEPHIGPDTRVVRLDGRGVTPGLVDGHAHLYGLGGALESVALRGAASAQEAAERVAAAAAERAPGEWITGRGWDQNLWASKEFPHHRVLDAVTPAHPVAVRRVDGHALWANRKAMELAGITAKTQAPPGGQILRDARGRPTGVFIDAAMALVEVHIPEPSAEVKRRRILAAARVAVQHGLTGVHEMGISDETAAVYRDLAASGELPLRVYAFLSGSPAVAAGLATRAPEIGPADGTFTLRGVKLYADGALGSRGAALLAPYTDAPRYRGLWVTEPPSIEAAAQGATAGGWQLAIHAIGDAGNRAVLDAYEAIVRANPARDLRLRVEHAQVVAPEDLPRFGALGVIASMQPTHATSDMPWAEARVGAARIAGAYAWRTILASGGRILGGSDFPVEEVPPLHGLWAAVTRQDRAGNPAGGWYPEQRLTLEEAVRIFTVEAAYASFTEAERGTIRQGYVADVTVFDRPLREGDLPDTVVDLTVVGGSVVFDRAAVR